MRRHGSSAAMAQIILDNLSPGRLLMLGDAALQSRDADLALGLYSAALRATDGSLTLRLHNRIGLARSPNPRTLATLEVLQKLENHEKVFVGEGLATWQKTLPFMEDERFMGLVEKHADLLPLANWHWNLNTVLWAVQQAKDLPGDFVELGVFKGHTTIFAAEYVQFAEWGRRWVLYDTFDGIPDDQVDAGWATVNQNTYRGHFSYEEVRDRFSEFPNIDVVKGRVPEILRETCPEQIAFIHMDLNNVSAEIAALDVLYDRITPGGVIVFDDYGWAVSRLQFEAENAWFADRGLKILACPTGQGLFVKPAA